MKYVTYVSNWYDSMNGGQYSVNHLAILVDDYTLILKTEDSLDVRRSKTPLEVRPDGSIINYGMFATVFELNEDGTRLSLMQLAAMKFTELTKYLKIERGF